MDPVVVVADQNASRVARVNVFNDATETMVSIGDINGDGADDFLVSERVPPVDRGRAYVVFGSTGGLPSTINLFSAADPGSYLDGVHGFMIGDKWLLGAAAAVGDVNGDGVDDFLLGSYIVSGGGRAGAYIIYGNASSAFPSAIDPFAIATPIGREITSDQTGLITLQDRLTVTGIGDFNNDGVNDYLVADFDTYIVSDTNFVLWGGVVYVVFGGAGAAPVQLTNLGAGGIAIPGTNATSSVGRTAAGIGDVNGDGFDDIAFSGGGGFGPPSIVVIYGHATSGAETLDIDNLSPSAGFRLTGLAPYAGAPLTAAGDINGDGLADFLVSQGQTYVIFGKSGGFGGDLDVTNLGSNGFTLSEGGPVTVLGDIDGDGFGDLLIGSPYADHDPDSSIIDSGSAYLFYGGASFSGLVDVATAPRTVRFDGKGLGAHLGRGVSAGDFNGDGAIDFLLEDNTGGWIVWRAPAPIVDTGGSGGDTMNGAGGDDVLDGADGNDTLNGGLGADQLTGGQGADTLNGGDGDDTLDGGIGGDWLDGGNGADAMAGGTGDDTYVVGSAGDTISELGGEGNDVVRATVSYVLGANLETLALDGTADINGGGNSLANLIVGNAGNNSLDGADGNDTLKGGDGNDTLDGGSGSDILVGGNGFDDLDGQDDNDILNGGAGDDEIYGGSGGDQLDGGADNDTLSGGAGNDQLTGGDGADILGGGDGSDFLTGGLGADAMTGGLGDDVYYVDDAGDTTVEASGEGGDTVHATMNWTLGANLETLILDGSGNIDGTGNGLINAITGNGGDNSLDGAGGDDVLKGMNGDDTLVGGTGADTLLGGAGADTFVVRQESVRQSHLGGALEIDTVKDLVKAQGDKLDLSAIDADSNTAGDQAFSLSTDGGTVFHHLAGEMTLNCVGGVTTLELDVDGDGAADYRMLITGNVTGDSGSWIL